MRRRRGQRRRSLARLALFCTPALRTLQASARPSLGSHTSAYTCGGAQDATVSARCRMSGLRLQGSRAAYTTMHNRSAGNPQRIKRQVTRARCGEVTPLLSMVKPRLVDIDVPHLVHCALESRLALIRVRGGRRRGVRRRVRGLQLLLLPEGVRVAADWADALQGRGDD